jgi:hypothetical protein
VISRNKIATDSIAPSYKIRAAAPNFGIKPDRKVVSIGERA